MSQLTLDGHEITLARVNQRVRTIGSAETAVLRRAVEQGGLITSSQAGRVIHQRRAQTGCRDPYMLGDGCCRHAAGHGGEVLRQLASRGIVEKISRGLWAVLQPGEEPSS